MTAPKNLLIWCFNEMNKNSFNTYAQGLGPSYEAVLLTVPDAASVSPAIFAPTLFREQGFSARKLEIGHKRQLDIAIDSIASALQGVGEFDKITTMILPFWYRIALGAALTKASLWPKTTMIEAATQRSLLAFIGTGDAIATLPVGIVTGPQLGYTKSSGRHIWETKKFKKLPPTLQYWRRNPVTQLDADTEAQYVIAKGHQSIDWLSFSEDGTLDVDVTDDDVS